jgi:hypothetical protein
VLGNLCDTTEHTSSCQQQLTATTTVATATATAAGAGGAAARYDCDIQHRIAQVVHRIMPWRHHSLRCTVLHSAIGTVSLASGSPMTRSSRTVHQTSCAACQREREREQPSSNRATVACTDGIGHTDMGRFLDLAVVCG